MKRVVYKKYAGIRINGKVPSEDPTDGHIDRASWLTAMVESGGKYGTVISYDGTGMTAGLHQAIAVYPKELLHPDENKLNDQGPLWKLLDRCFKATPDLQSTQDMITALNIAGLKLVNGVVYDSRDGKVVDGLRLRETLTGHSSGCMPVSGAGRASAEFWARMFHEYFSEKRTFSIQNGWGEEKFIKRLERTKLRYVALPYLRNKVLVDAFYPYGTQVGLLKSADLEPEFDLAMCMWLCHSVNAPGIALKKLCHVSKNHSNYVSSEKMDQKSFARALIKSLGDSSFGRWDDDIKNGRYQRTRKFAMKIWPTDLFVGGDAVMPADL